MKKTNVAQRVALGSMLTALMLTLGYVESLIPLGVAIPGIKLGLSNSVLMYALYMMGIKEALVLMILKVVLSGLMFGGVTAMMYSLAGAVLSMIAMILIMKVPKVSVITVSMIGAVFHNVGQVVLAMMILNTSKLLYYLAVLMVVGIFTGMLTGIVANSVMRALDKIAANHR